MTNESITFISYSRRQLYFAEALALHLQKEGLNIWFDLQQLQAGTEWSAGLKDGIRRSKQMVVVVSEACMDSPYTRDEWEDFAKQGYKIALAIYEPVDLPEVLQGLPTYDFRGKFDKNLKDLEGFLKGEMELRHDPMPSPNRFDIPTKLPLPVWLTLFAQFGAFIALSLSFVMALFLNTNDLLRQLQTSPLPGGLVFFLVMLALSLLIGGRYAWPFLQHKLEYKKIKRSALINLLLLLPALIAIGQIGTNMAVAEPSTSYLYLVAGIALLTLFVYLFLLRRSAALLRWQESEEDLQDLRRRVHQPLISTEKFDIDIANQGTVNTITYTLHADAADQPFAKWVDKEFMQVGHIPVNVDENPERHIALLSNRSSDAWVQQITSSYAGELVFIVISTIEFDDALKETGRYQWVDARGGDKPDIAGLARSLGAVESWKREAALEATPARINRWKVPDSITLLKRMMELFAIYIFVFGLTDLLGFFFSNLGVLDGEGGNLLKSFVLVVLGGLSFWLANRSLVYRKVSGRLTYLIFGGSVILASVLGTVPLLRTLLWVIIPALLYAALRSYFWLPVSAKVHADEVGVQKEIARKFRHRNIILVSFWVCAVIGFALVVQLNLLQ